MNDVPMPHPDPLSTAADAEERVLDAPAARVVLDELVDAARVVLAEVALLGRQQRVAPLMVQPGFAADFKALPAQCDLPAGGQLRLAVVIAGLARIRPLA